MHDAYVLGGLARMVQPSPSFYVCHVTEMKCGWKIFYKAYFRSSPGYRTGCKLVVFYLFKANLLRHFASIGFLGSHLALCGVVYPPGRGYRAHFVIERAKLGA